MPTKNGPSLSRRSFLVSSGASVSAIPVAALGQASAETPPAAPVSPGPTRFRVNGTEVSTSVEPRVTLLDFLREHQKLTGTKKGCNEGACGSCTVLLDGNRVNACLTLVAQCEGSEVTTVEGLGTGDTLHPVQAAFVEHDAFQCGYCTPGQIVSAVACIKEGHATDHASVREFMSGNICRCSAYPQITAAVLDAAKRMKG